MSSAATIDFDALVAPIAGEHAAGEDLREDISPLSVYYKIKDARAAARAAERASLQSGEIDDGFSPEWKTVLEVAPEILTTRAKDLEVVAWYVEALVRTRGFAGLRDGFRLARELVEQYWDGLFPLPDEDGVATKVAPLTGLNGEDAEGTLIFPIATIKITEHGDFGELRLWDYRRAREMANVTDPEVLQARAADGAVTMDQFQATLSTTSPQFLLDLVEDITAAQAEFSALSAALDERCGHDAPPTSNIRNALSEAYEQIEYLTRDIIAPLRASAEPAGDVESEAPAQGGVAAPVAAAQPGQITTRAEAFQQINKIAAFFREREPHSPLPYLLDQAVRWGSMPLTTLVAELIPDESARSHFHLLTGIRAADDNPFQADE